ncbi:MAG TPA: hypothetical protein VFG68_21060 [Fimbriiglobus sp.]|nr:hypothetical protein [Fimbriiglobus sp.]
MLRSAAWGLSALALAPVALAADPAEKPGLVSRWLGSKPEPEKTFADMPARPPVVIGPLDPAVLAAALRAEQDAWRRRMDVCLKLKQIALDQANEPLARQADDLERQATTLYHQRTARLGVKAGVSGPADVLDRSISVAPPEPVGADRPIAAHARAFREVGR